jgi:hypothetical protein
MLGADDDGMVRRELGNSMPVVFHAVAGRDRRRGIAR